MRIWPLILCLLALNGSALGADRPITMAATPLGEQLRKWDVEGTAAGNLGDFYDNRDRGHSILDLTLYPQFQKVVYSAADRSANRDFGAAMVVQPHVVIGNSSTAAPATATGSNTRLLYTLPRGIEFLYQQYTHNNLYVYPEHRDHDPGHNGFHPTLGPDEAGWGDLFPANTPYLITSQNSSYWDKPFVAAVAGTLAAFRPEVKKKLVESGLLMPAVQMCFRMSNKNVAANQYLSGIAHPSAFDPNFVDELKMAQLAHEIRAENIPPMVQMKVVEEEEMTSGRDFFEAAGVSEKMADTPCAIARIFRGVQKTRRMKISAEGSFDINKKPLKFSWVVLRGDEKQISIKPSENGMQAEIVVSWQERHPVTAGSALESNRIDIGVFANNGTYYSAPAFVTFFCLDNEGRTYDQQGKIAEVAYGMGDLQLLVADYSGFFSGLSAKSPDPAMALLKALLKEPEIAAMQQVAQPYAAAASTLPKLRERQRELSLFLARAQPGPGRTKAEEDAKFINNALAAAEKSSDQILSQKLPVSNMSIKERLTSIFMVMLNDAELVNETAQIRAALVKADPKRQQAFDAAQKEFKDAAIAPATAYGKLIQQKFNARLLGDVLYPGIISHSLRANYVDGDISAPKSWRDVYHYDSGGKLTGWTRYEGEKSTDFNWEGMLVQQKDARGRCAAGVVVSYVREGEANPRARPDIRPLKIVPTAQVVRYEFDGDGDLRGHAVGRGQLQ